MGCKIVADDFGMSAEINQAISKLVNNNIVSKVSVMANESIKYSIDDAEKDVEVGLHINLVSYTKGMGINKDRKISLLKLLFFIYKKKINVNQIIGNIKDQFDVIVDKGFKVSCMDTHQHVHIIPIVLKSMIIVAKERGINTIRCITMERRYLIFYLYSLIRFGFLTQVPKMILLYIMGALMKLKLDAVQINYCNNLILMPLARGGNYSGLLNVFLNMFKDKDAEIVVHPGIKSICNDEESDSPDTYSGRYIEYCSLFNLK